MHEAIPLMCPLSQTCGIFRACRSNLCGEKRLRSSPLAPHSLASSPSIGTLAPLEQPFGLFAGVYLLVTLGESGPLVRTAQWITGGDANGRPRPNALSRLELSAANVLFAAAFCRESHAGERWLESGVNLPIV